METSADTSCSSSGEESEATPTRNALMWRTEANDELAERRSSGKGREHVRKQKLLDDRKGENEAQARAFEKLEYMELKADRPHDTATYEAPTAFCSVGVKNSLQLEEFKVACPNSASLLPPLPDSLRLFAKCCCV
jgi:hypothetical protein